MLLSELLEKYEGSQAKISDGLVSRDIAAPHINEKHYSREIRTQRIDNQTRTVIFHYDNPLMLAVWFVDSEQFEPDYIISEVPKRRGRPAQDKVTMAFTLDRIVAEEIQKLPEGDRSAEVNKTLREKMIEKISKSHMDWNEEEKRYKGLMPDGKTLCVDGAVFAAKFDAETKDPADDEHKVFGVLTRFPSWVDDNAEKPVNGAYFL